MCQPLGHGIEGNYFKLKTMEKRIWNFKELEANPDFRKDNDGDWFHKNQIMIINSYMVGQTVNWCEKNGYFIQDWMIATDSVVSTTEPEYGELVYVWDDELRPLNPDKRILLWRHKNSTECVCVNKLDEENYKNGEEFNITKWRNYEKIQQKTPQQEIAEKVGKTVEELYELFKPK